MVLRIMVLRSVPRTAFDWRPVGWQGDLPTEVVVDTPCPGSGQVGIKIASGENNKLTILYVLSTSCVMEQPVLWGHDIRHWRLNCAG